MKHINRVDWNSIKNLITQDVKLSDGTALRIIKDSESGLVEVILDHQTLAKQNQTDLFEPVLLCSGFYQD